VNPASRPDHVADLFGDPRRVAFAASTKNPARRDCLDAAMMYY
jgi:hypothetical protein